MAEEYHRLPDQKYTEAEYLFKTIEMAKSDEDYDVELLNSSSPPTTDFIYSWKRRQRPHRRYTVGAPPAPPSTPTSLTANNTPTPSPTTSSTMAGADEEPPMRGFFVERGVQRVPKYKKKLRELQRTDAELAEMFNVVTITSTGIGADRSLKLQAERGISANSRVIRKHDSCTKIFKIHRNPKEFFREPGDEEDSVSAPEYDIKEDHALYRRRMMRLKTRSRRVARMRHEERMETLVDHFDTTMGFNDA